MSLQKGSTNKSDTGRRSAASRIFGNKKIYKLTAAGIFAAIVVVLQCTLGLIVIPGTTVNLNFVLIPIVIAGIIYGP
ncbi:MAG: hypothetical protein J6U75_02800, partial [Clostridia bacterium]|nr:hypothetical protein [Clostridia bacterium]